VVAELKYLGTTLSNQSRSHDTNSEQIKSDECLLTFREDDIKMNLEIVWQCVVWIRLAHHDIVACRPVARQRQPSKPLDNGPLNSKRGIVFSARSVLMAAQGTVEYVMPSYGNN
jgi:hypothetical protein